MGEQNEKNVFAENENVSGNLLDDVLSNFGGESPSLRDVRYYRTKCRKLQSEVKILKNENAELAKKSGTKKKKKKRRKKGANMEKLLDIMNSMNEQITKLAEAVTDAVQSSDDEKVCDYRKLYGTDDRKEIENVNEDGMDLKEGNENDQEKEDDEEDSVKKRASDSKAHLMKDLREHLFAKV